MSKAHPPGFKRKLVLEQRINSGKKIEGLTGYVPAQMKCCSGSTTVYIPVKVVGIKLSDCSFSLRVKAITSEVIVSQRKEDTFTTGPKNFFQTAEEIAEWELYLAKVAEFNRLMDPFSYHRGTVTYMRKTFKSALEEAPPLLKAELEEEFADKDDGLKSMTRDWLQDNYKRLITAKLFPEYANSSEFDPEEDSEEDWD